MTNLDELLEFDGVVRLVSFAVCDAAILTGSHTGEAGGT